MLDGSACVFFKSIGTTRLPAKEFKPIFTALQALQGKPFKPFKGPFANSLLFSSLMREKETILYDSFTFYFLNCRGQFFWPFYFFLLWIFQLHACPFFLCVVVVVVFLLLICRGYILVKNIILMFSFLIWLVNLQIG